MKVLLITNGSPYPPTHGGKIRAWYLLRQIARYHDVTLLMLLDSPNEVQFIAHLQPYCVRVEAVVKQRQRPKGKLFLHLLRTMLKGQPPRNGIEYYEEMECKIKEITENQRFDIIQVEQSSMAPYIEFINNTNGVARLISLYDAGAVQLGRIAKFQPDFQSRFWAWLDWLFLRYWEPTYLARNFDKGIVVSPIDEALLRQSNQDLELVVVPNGVDTTHYSPLPEPTNSKDIVFVGNMRYTPNVDGAIFFCKEIFPLIKQQVPQAKLLLVGSTPTDPVRALASEDVVVTGHVESVIPYYQNSVVSIVPLRAGSGTRLKILESMALGRPVVSTTLGAEGLDVAHNENILIADTPVEFADQTVQLLRNGDLRRRLITNGRQLVETKYDWQIIFQKLLQIYTEISQKERRDSGYGYSNSSLRR